jgi:hypothetical protein
MLTSSVAGSVKRNGTSRPYGKEEGVGDERRLNWYKLGLPEYEISYEPNCIDLWYPSLS